MSAGNFKELMAHVGHKVECVYYGDSKDEAVNAAVECLDCFEVLFDYDREEEE